MSTNSDSPLNDARDNSEKLSRREPTSSKLQYNDRLLTAAFEEQIKLVDQSTIGGNKVEDEKPSPSIPAIKLATKTKRDWKKSQQLKNSKQDNDLIFTNKSRKFRFGECSPDQIANTDSSCFKKAAESDIKETSAQEGKSSSQMFKQGHCIIPPPVDLAKFPQIENVDEAHSSMLMSWYMAGYHTGYFQAMKKFK